VAVAGTHESSAGNIGDGYDNGRTHKSGGSESGDGDGRPVVATAAMVMDDSIVSDSSSGDG
jgi:hypothetical protein